MKNISKYYSALGIRRTEGLSSDSLKAAYKKAVKEWHPDLNPHRLEEADAKFKEIQEAYSQLSITLKMKGGNIKASHMNDKEFLKTMGYEELSKITSDTLIEINFERASSLINSEDSPGAISFVDAKLMKKLLFWAKGTDLTAKTEVLDKYGHFTNQAILNILEYAQLYEMGSGDKKERAVKQFVEFLFGENIDNDIIEESGSEKRLAELIRDFVNENYLASSDGYVHKSHKKTKELRYKNAALKAMQDNIIPKNVSKKLSSLLEEQNYVNAEEVAKDAYNKLGGESMAVTTHQVAGKAEADLEKIEDELQTIAGRLKMPKDEMVAKVRLGEFQSHPALEFLSERISFLATELEALGDLIEKSKSNDAVAAKNLKVILGLLEQLKRLSEA